MTGRDSPSTCFAAVYPPIASKIALLMLLWSFMSCSLLDPGWTVGLVSRLRCFLGRFKPPTKLPSILRPSVWFFVYPHSFLFKLGERLYFLSSNLCWFSFFNFHMFFLGSWDVVSRVWKRPFFSMHCLLITPLTPSLLISYFILIRRVVLDDWVLVPDYFDGGLKTLAFPSLG